MTRETTAGELRDIVRDLIADSMEIHRASREAMEGSSYERPVGAPTDDEVTDFLVSNSMLDNETVEQLIDPGLLGFHAKRANTTEQWLAEFAERVSDWAETNAWQGADAPWRIPFESPEPEESKLWTPKKGRLPGWVDASPSALLLAQEILNSGRVLSELGWKEFEDLISELLARGNWKIESLRRTRDGGVDVLGIREDAEVGSMRTLWQAKKYDLSHKVRLAQVRDLSGVLDRQRATKAIIVTTSALTRGALEWVRQDSYRLGYKDHGLIEQWVRAASFKDRTV